MLFTPDMLIPALSEIPQNNIGRGLTGMAGLVYFFLEFGMTPIFLPVYGDQGPSTKHQGETPVSKETNTLAHPAIPAGKGTTLKHHPKWVNSRSTKSKT